MEIYDLNTTHRHLIHSWEYPGGEIGVRATAFDYPKEEDFKLIHRIQNSGDFFRLIMYLDALRWQQIFPSEVVIPYFPYARQDRVAVPGDPYTLGLVYHLLERTIDPPQTCTKISTIDLHGRSPSFYLRNISATSLTLEYIDGVISNTLQLDGSIVDAPFLVVAPDKGARGRALACAELHKDRCVGVVFADKKNPDTGRLEEYQIVSGEDTLKDFISQHPGYPVVVIDDICDGGGTFLLLAQALEAAGCPKNRRHLWTTHGIYSKGTADLLNAYETLGCSNSFISPALSEWNVTVIDINSVL